MRLNGVSVTVLGGCQVGVNVTSEKVSITGSFSGKLSNSIRLSGEKKGNNEKTSPGWKTQLLTMTKWSMISF